MWLHEQAPEPISVGLASVRQPEARAGLGAGGQSSCQAKVRRATRGGAAGGSGSYPGPGDGPRRRGLVVSRDLAPRMRHGSRLVATGGAVLRDGPCSLRTVRAGGHRSPWGPCEFGAGQVWGREAGVGGCWFSGT